MVVATAVVDEERQSLTPTQAANYKRLRSLIFTVAISVLAYCLWQALGTGELEHPHLTGTRRTVAWVICTALGVGAAWLMSCAAAKSLCRSIK